VNLHSVIGLPGLNIVCGSCNRKAHLHAKDFPHVASIIRSFQEAIDALKRDGKEVVVMPAMDRYWGVFSQDVALSGLRVTAVLDSRPKRVGVQFMGCRTEALTPETIDRHRDKTFVIFPWVEYDRAISALQDAGIPPAAVLSWNETFGQHMNARPVTRTLAPVRELSAADQAR
jgi:hypothetical protein